MSEFKVRLLSPKLARRVGWHGTASEPIPTLGHWCPACCEVHDFAVDRPFRNGARWTFGGDALSPTFSPSMNISWGPNSRGQTSRCHYWLRAGEIEYLPDCTHGFAGQKIPLPDLPPSVWRWADLET